MEMREMKEDNSSYMFRINRWGYHQNCVEPLFQSFFNFLFFLDSLLLKIYWATGVESDLQDNWAEYWVCAEIHSNHLLDQISKSSWSVDSSALRSIWCTFVQVQVHLFFPPKSNEQLKSIWFSASKGWFELNWLNSSHCINDLNPVLGDSHIPMDCLHEG